SLPIRAAMDGLWYTTGEGQRLRLTPLHDGRAVLSGVPDPFTTTDPVTVVTALPEWVPLEALHPETAVSGLTLCWWWDGTTWASSPTANARNIDDLRLPWAESSQATITTIEQIALGAGITPRTDRITQFVQTSESDPATARTMLTGLFA
ncbi:MAG: hypothetical protein JHC79_22540, partial [Williamsia sp.]|nr:hypothetical protein [Williamsia sp.]